MNIACHETTQRGLLERAIAPESEPISLEEVKVFLRIDADNEAEDAMLEQCIRAVREAAEHYCRHSFASQSWKLHFDDYAPSVIRLPMGPVQSVTHVKLIAASGDATEVSDALYGLSGRREKLWLNVAYMSDQIEICYVAGYTDAENVPDAVKQGMLHHIAHLYERKEEGELPLQSQQLYRPFCRFSL